MWTDSWIRRKKKGCAVFFCLFFSSDIAFVGEQICQNLYDAHGKFYKRYGGMAKLAEEAMNARPASVLIVNWVMFLCTKRKKYVVSGKVDSCTNRNYVLTDYVLHSQRGLVMTRLAACGPQKYNARGLQLQKKERLGNRASNPHKSFRTMLLTGSWSHITRSRPS